MPRPANRSAAVLQRFGRRRPRAPALPADPKPRAADEGRGAVRPSETGQPRRGPDAFDDAGRAHGAGGLLPRRCRAPVDGPRARSAWSGRFALAAPQSAETGGRVACAVTAPGTAASAPAHDRALDRRRRLPAQRNNAGGQRAGRGGERHRHARGAIRERGAGRDRIGNAAARSARDHRLHRRALALPHLERAHSR